MRGPLVAGLLWTLAVGGILLLWPGSVQSDGCWRLVDAPPACDALLRDMNSRIWWQSTVPMLAVILGGYLLVGGAAIRSLRRRRRSALDATGLSDPSSTD